MISNIYILIYIYYLLRSYFSTTLKSELNIQALKLEKVSCYIAKWTFQKCPKSKIAKKFFRKKAVQTILLEGWRKK